MADTNMRILVVDDMPNMRKTIRNTLKHYKFVNVVGAEDGTMALKKLEKEDFDFVILDWNMPGMNGCEVLKALRGDEKTKNIPVLMITGEADKETIVQAIQGGVNDYLLKPFTAKTLETKIDKIFG